MTVFFRSTRRSLAVISALGIAFASPAYAACTQDRAVYTDRDDDYTLTFKHFPEDQPVATSNEFVLQRNETDLKLDGVVMRDQAARPNGLIMFNCPSGDATGDELAACTVWEGVPYALKDGVDAEYLPKAKEPAAQALLLPNLSGAMSNFNFKLEKPIETFPWEVFRFKECVPEQ
ncbi:hypothetical protein [Phyllobacterium sp. YR531]|uniref:hypothetical protein n=1 Tax=Phyllobacterium sp. YR531 TaxID=1144343 RepID=UPI00026FBB5B|nr:hypothetical protein [Phyllobacterium sp. YR531]EJM99827.1 hypothetical protein PMI41_03719 [Phyllobacterium sp. YR531]